MLISETRTECDLGRILTGRHTETRNLLVFELSWDALPSSIKKYTTSKMYDGKTDSDAWHWAGILVGKNEGKPVIRIKICTLEFEPDDEIIDIISEYIEEDGGDNDYLSGVELDNYDIVALLSLFT